MSKTGKRRWLRYFIYGVLAVIILIAAGAGFLVWKIGRSVTGTYDEAGLASVTRYSGETPISSKPLPSRENPLFQNEFSAAGFAVPGVKYRPWTRWWWPGNGVNAEELRREVRLFKDHHFGGAEVQPFTIGVNTDSSQRMADFYGFDTPSYYQNLGAMLDEASKQGLQMDLTVGSAWPPAGPQITPLDSLQTLAAGEQRVTGGQIVSLTLPEAKPTFFYYMLSLARTLSGKDLGSFFAPKATPIAVLAARIVEDHRSRNPLSLSDQVRLDAASVTVLTSQVGPDRRLVWQAPAGDWMVMAFYRMSAGLRPLFGSAQRDPGYIIDYLDSARVLSDYNYSFGNRTNLPQYYSRTLRALFNDSLELAVDRHITPDFLPYFRERRGYDLTPHLPTQIAPGYDNFYQDTFGMSSLPKYVLGPDDERVRYDYSLTVSELFQQQFLDPTMEWGEKYGLLTRTQPYGLKIDVIKASGHIHIPETEALYGGGSEMFLRMVSSGAHLYNRPVVSSESFVHQTLDYMTTPQKIRIGANKLFVSGINHIFYHGTPYRLGERGYGETGWAPFSQGDARFSSNISEADPFWDDIKSTNDYIARSQFILRQGTPEAQVLVYYPFLGFADDLSMGTAHQELYLNGIVPGVDRLHTPKGVAKWIAEKLGANPKPETVWLRKIWPVLQELDRAGLNWDWVNDDSLQQAAFDHGAIQIRGNRYAAVLLPEVRAVQLASAEKLARLVDAGARVWLYGQTPREQPGFLNYRENDARVAALMQQVAAHAATFSADDPAKWMEQRPPQEIAFAHRYETLQQISRRLPDGGLFVFLWNASDRDLPFELSAKGQFASYYWMDPEDGAAYPAKPGADRILKGALGPYRSLILYAAKRPLPGAANAMPPVKQVIEQSRIASRIPLRTWNLTVQGTDVAAGRITRTDIALADWRSDPELRYVSSKGVYEATFDRGADSDPTYLLDLGKVYFTAAVKVNGQAAGKLVAAPYRADITRLVKPGKNTVQITVTPALRNRLIGRGKRGDKEYSQYKGLDDTLMPAGLSGPVEVWRITK